MVIIYKVQPLTWTLFRGLVKIPNIGMANIIAGKRIVPELLQDKASPENIADQTLAILSNREKFEEIKKELSKVREKLGQPGAPDKAARAVVDTIQKLQR